MVVGGSGWVGERTGAVEEGKWTYRHGLRRVNVSIKSDILTTEIVSYGWVRRRACSHVLIDMDRMRRKELHEE
jgi:hypothetical protein